MNSFAPISDAYVSPEASERPAVLLAQSEQWDRDADKLADDHAAHRARFGIVSRDYATSKGQV